MTKRVLLFIWALFLNTHFVNAGQLPYKDIESGPNSFTGVENDLSYKSKEFITIGFFNSFPQDSLQGKKLITLLQKEISRANNTKPLPPRPIKLAIRQTTDTWSTGSKEIINLVHKDKAVALLTLFSAESHLAAQIAAKAYIPVISIAATDATLNQARVPWIFRLPPSDASQAKSLIESCKEHQCTPGIISEIQQDMRIGSKELLQQLNKKGIAPKFHFQLRETLSQTVINKIKKQQKTSLFLYLTSPQLLSTIEEIKNQNHTPPLYIPWIAGFDIKKLKTTYPAKIHYIAPLSPPEGITPTPEENLPPLHCYTKDGVNMIIKAIKETNGDRIAIRNYLGKHKHYPSKCTSYLFNHGGGNTLPGRVVH